MVNAARVHSVDAMHGIESVVMVAVVAAGKVIVAGAVGGRALGPCSAALTLIMSDGTYRLSHGILWLPWHRVAA